MARPHPLAMEAMAEALPQRQRVEADPAVEPNVRAAPDALVRPYRPHRQFVAERHARSAAASDPNLELAALENQLEPLAEVRLQPVDDAGVEEEPGRKGIREDEPDGTHDAVRAPSTRAMRSASDAPSSP